MTPADLKAIADEGDPDVMAEALRQIAAERGPLDAVYMAMVDAWGLSRAQADLLHLLWRHKGQGIPWERIVSHLGVADEIDVQHGALKHLRASLRRAGNPVEVKTLHGIGLRLTQRGPVPWDTGQ